MAVKVKTSGKVVMILLVLAATLRWQRHTGGIKDHRKQNSRKTLDVLPCLMHLKLHLVGNATMLPLPSEEQSVNGGTKIVWKIMAWNSQFPLNVCQRWRADNQRFIAGQVKSSG